MRLLLPFLPVLMFLASSLAFGANPVPEPSKMVIEYTDADVKIGPLSFVARKTTMTEVEAALGKPDRVVTAASNVFNCYDRLGLRFEFSTFSKSKAVDVSIFMDEKEIASSANFAPAKVFAGVIRFRGLEFKAPCKAKDVYPKLNPLFPRSEAVPGNDKFGNTIYRVGNCRTSFNFRKDSGEVTYIRLDGPMPK
ncbi:YjgB family protein [Luteolibacter arcticus]|uniref:YjgB family protein n=1 Tax=Luteolibacter arcticus TaxID=1581411 RepID=A0ABT3GJ96_9BACT|nr:YjgB family protein [Luteolibacter arcticus]MCW1923579.1 YjgB family protein [Luteolibacter arcticus]